MQVTQPEGHLVVPQSGSESAVLVLHAWWGLNGTMTDLCTRLADAGYTAFAPDLYHGKVAASIPEAETYSDEIWGTEKPRADVLTAARFLDEHAGQPERGLAVIGFSLGAFYALELSVMAPEIVQSVVAFYGTRPGDYDNSQAAYLGHFADLDEFESQTEVDSLKVALKRAGRPVAFYRYAGTEHWFFEPDRPEYDQAAAELAWDRTLTFLSQRLGGTAS